MRAPVAVTYGLPALIAGGLQAASLAAPWAHDAPQGWLQILSLAALAWLLRSRGTALVGSPAKARLRAGFFIAWTFATAWLVGSFWWLFISMHTYGGLNAALAAAGVLALALGLALYYAVAGAVFTAWQPAGAGLRATLTSAFFFAALWTVAELLRGTWFTGFPWGAGGYAHVQGPLAALAPWIGVYGIGFVAAFLAALVARVLPLARGAACGLRTPGRLGALIVLVVLLALLPRVATLLPPPANDPALRMEVALLQGNIPQDIKFVPGSGIAEALRWYGQELEANQAPLVITPETAIPLLPSQLPPDYLPALAARYEDSNQAALVGIPLGDDAVGYTNSVLGFAPGRAAPYRYDKHHLVPFGEFIPTGFRWFVDLMHIPLGDFNRGALVQPNFDWLAQRLAPNICFEDLFGEELAARFADPAQAPTAFVNVSNLGWFGTSIALDQHLQIARMRALEFRRAVLTATNTGITAIIDANGRVSAQLPRGERAVLRGAFQGHTQITPFAAWAARWGLAPLWLLGLGGALLAWLLGRRAR